MSFIPVCIPFTRDSSPAELKRDDRPSMRSEAKWESHIFATEEIMGEFSPRSPD